MYVYLVEHITLPAHNTTTMREIYRKSPLQGFQSTKVESIASTSDGRKLFTGCSDGTIAYYECTRNGSSSNAYYDCHMVELISRSTREKKPITSLKVVEAWNVMIGICDSYVVAIDLHSYTALNQMPETKGTNLYCINERTSLLCVGQKHKIKVFSWQGGMGGGFVLKKELSFSESPRLLMCTGGGGGCIIAGFKKHYDTIDAHSYANTKLLDFDREHKLVSVEVPVTATRPMPSVILSVGQQGSLVDVFGGNGVSLEERIEWASPPMAAHVSVPFIISMLQDAIEIHDIGSLSSLQRIRFPAPGAPISMSAIDSFAGGGGSTSAVLVASSDAVQVLSMVPLSLQVMRLVEEGAFEDALNICSSCRAHGGGGSSQLADIDVRNIHEKFGSVLYRHGDFDGAVVNYLAANSDMVEVLLLFPDFVPQQLIAAMFPQGTPSYVLGGVAVPSPQSHTRLTGAILNRASAAVVQYCEKMRPKITEEANKAEGRRPISAMGSYDHSRLGTSFATAGDNSDSPSEDPVKRSVLLDTVLVNALVSSSSISASRRNSVIEVLSGSNRCHIESCAVLLASQGNSFTEALLWLYRSHGEHRRVLSALNEDRCVGSGTAWSKSSFYQWTAEYLCWLWFSEDTTLPPMVMPALKPVIEYDAWMGLGVLTGGSKRPTTTGGRGVDSKEVVAFLESIKNPGNSSESTKSNPLPHSAYLPSTPPVPLLNGRSLAVTYLEWLVGSGSASTDVLDEYAQLLMEGVPLRDTVDHSKNDLTILDSDSDELRMYKIFRTKLQTFLESSLPYHPERIMKFLPQELLHEYALLLSRLGSHEEVLTIYVHQLRESEAAEAYCDKIYSQQLKRETEAAKRGERADIQNEGKDVYLCLIKVQLALASPHAYRDDSTSVSSSLTQLDALRLAISTAEKYFDRLNPCDVLDILPSSAPLTLLQNFFSKSIEHQNSKKRNMQILHQLLRVHEVNLRTNDSEI